MINEQTINDQLELARKAIEEMNRQNAKFDQAIETALSIAPEGDKKTILNVKNLSETVMRLARQGKVAEAEELIKNFR